MLDARQDERVAMLERLKNRMLITKTYADYQHYQEFFAFMIIFPRLIFGEGWTPQDAFDGLWRGCFNYRLEKPLYLFGFMEHLIFTQKDPNNGWRLIYSLLPLAGVGDLEDGSEYWWMQNWWQNARLEYRDGLRGFAVDALSFPGKFTDVWGHRRPRDGLKRTWSLKV